MKPHKEVRISGWAAHMTTGVSVTLALLTLGIIAMLWLAATSESRRMMEKMEVSVIIADGIGEDRAVSVCEAIRKQPFAANVRYISSREALENWKEATGEDLERVFGVNPLSPEIAFSVTGDHTSAAAIAKIKKVVSAIPGVAEVGTPDKDLIDNMNANIRRLSVGFLGLACVLLVISFVLINNTVRLSIYSRRFTIHTMQLVGATDGFIRRPFVLSNVSVGAISGVVASSVLAGLLALMPSVGVGYIEGLVPWSGMALIAASLVLIGAGTCGLASAFATTRHLRQDYEELFK